MPNPDSWKEILARNSQRDVYRSVIKPLLDWLLAITAIILLSPFLLIIAIAIKADTSGPVFFVQERLGRNGQVFRIFKFRSMITSNHISTANKLFENDPRITRVGGFIRKTSIDEIPQLLNILKGEMSFIGPRPPVPYYPKRIEDYNNFEIQRFLVKPGISGLAQVRCREIHDWDINIPIDVEYVKKCSFTYDLKLFAASLIFFFRSDNIYRKD